MINKLVLESKMFYSSTHHSQHYLIKHKSPQSITLTCLPYKTQSISSSTKSFISKHETLLTLKLNDNTRKEKPSKDSIWLTLDAISSSIKGLRKPVVAALLACLIMIMHMHVNSALAASGADSFLSSSGSASSSSLSLSLSSTSGVSKEWTQEDRTKFWKFMGFMVSFVSINVAIWNVYAFRKKIVGETNTIIKLQVGLLGSARSLESNDHTLSETLQALLEHHECIVSAYSSVNTKWSIKDGEKLFCKLLIKEHERFDVKTMIKMQNNKNEVNKSSESTELSDEFIAVTILMMVKGVLKLPKFNENAIFAEALQTLNSVSDNETIAYHVLWTPLVKSCTMSANEIDKYYPHLRSLIGFPTWFKWFSSQFILGGTL